MAEPEETVRRDAAHPASEVVGEWLNERASAVSLSPKARAVLEVLTTQPRMSTYGPAQQIANAAGVNMATVTRAAQSLGFSGWPALQTELRARYLSSLSVPEIAAEHGGPDRRGAFADSLRRDVESVALAGRHLRPEAVEQVVAAIAGSPRTLVIAEGSYAAIGLALAHNAQLAGYPVELLGGHSKSDLLNALSGVGPQDTVVAVSLWRLYARTVRSAQVARERGATVCALTDSASTPLAEAAHHVLVVPAEGAAFFPALTAAVAVAQALCARLAALDPARTGDSLRRAEELWDRFDVLHVPRAPRSAEPGR
ncbi:MurR/RpiR family transcriptional regulator [Streptomyces sp. NPDC059740]|uniref:MurR/RpiR family transcriptional regulator n=1 Tax=Streptomyces sp. NPDC059740 TaxID=3346926 RepID=UPI003669F3CF